VERAEQALEDLADWSSSATNISRSSAEYALRDQSAPDDGVYVALAEALDARYSPATANSPAPTGTMRRSNWYGELINSPWICSARERSAATPDYVASPLVLPPPA